ncbi:MAG: neuraminidase-like domain-containing protein [Cyclobacteriaceae bacterium]
MAQISSLSGIIYDAFNAPIPGITVNAFDKDLRTEQLVGTARTDAKGFYKIKYDASKFVLAENKSCDILIRVQRSARALLGESPVYFNVPQNFTLDYKIGNTPYQGLAEFDNLVDLIIPLLSKQKVKIADLKEDEKFKDITFLSSEIGESFDKISFVPLAYTFASTTKTPPDIFYGLFRTGFPTKLNDLLLVKNESIGKGLRAAIQANIISAKWDTEIDSIIKNLNALSAGLVLNSSNEDQHKGFKKIISTAIPKPELQRTFINTYLESESTPEQFWSSLATQNGFRDGKIIEDTKSIFNISSLTGYEPALTSLIYKESKEDKDLSELRGYAKFTTKDWATRISKLVATGELNDFPVGIAGETPEEKTKNYAVTLNDLVKSLYPTSVFSAGLNKDSANPFGDSKPDLKTFFINNPDFDLKTNKMNSEFEASKLDGVRNKERLKKELKNINRLYKLAPQYEHVSALRDLGIGSATEIVQKYSADQLTQKLEGRGVSAEESKTIYANALTVDKQSAAAVLAYKMRHDVAIYAITGGQPVSADYQSTFGDNISCDCEHCQSVYSPAAYFVDVMNFLNKKNNVAFDRLHDHRPDLVDILLTCENTNTPLPYIDLVNELLESIIVNQTTIAYQTKSTAAELVAYPQNILQAAYDKLKTSASSYQLPLDLPLETSRKLLEELDLSRQQILELFFSRGTQTIYTDLSIAKEVLNLSDGDVNIINGSTPISGVTGAASIQTILVETQLTYVELLQVLESYLINPVQSGGLRSLQIVSTDSQAPATCDITKLILTGINSAQLLKLIRFVRLQKKLAWNSFNVDRLLGGLNVAPFDLSADDFNNQILVPTANVVRFKNYFKITAQKAIAILGLIDARLYIDHTQDDQPVVHSLYDQLFRNKAISNPIDSGFNEKAESLTGSLTDHSSVLLSAFAISQDDFNLLRKGNNGLLAPVADVLTLENLSDLYKRASFASLLKLSIVDFFDAITVFGINPFQGLTHVDQTLMFLDDFNFIKTSNFNLKELKYLLLNKDSESSIALTTEFIAGVLEATQSALKKISNETGAADLTTNPTIRSSAEALVIDKFGSLFKTDHATTKTILDETVRFSGDTFKSFLTALLENTFLNSPAPFFTLDASGNAIPSLPDYFNSYWHANKIVVLVKKLKLNAEELSFFTSHALQLSIDALINNTVPVPFVAFKNLSAMARLISLWKLPASHLLEVLGIILNNGANAKANFMSALATSASADMDMLQYLLGDLANTADKGGLSFAFPDDYKTGENLLQLWKCISLIQKLGVNANEFITAVQMNNNSFLTALLKSKHTETEWLSVIQTISDQLRTRRRDALVAFLLNDLSLTTFRTSNLITDSNSLYEYLLIDVEMDACMLTSRIKQAIGSVQLFVDRCLMKLEPYISLDSDFATQWNSWRKQYRVWEANRKVFLYPENWIEPELRDDKSPFFQELESKLRQNEVTEETAQDALQSYLEKLDAVANLEIIGIYADKLTDINHVFGRTKAVPHEYFYRSQQKFIWSPWEKVDADVAGDHVLPVVWNNRLLLFWLSFNEKQESEDDGFKVPASGDTIAPALRYWEVKLVWSEYKKDKWTSKKMSKEFIKTPVNNVINKFQLESSIEAEKLIINLFSWLSLGNAGFFDNLGLGVFIFDGCNNSPSVHMVGWHDPLNQTIYTAQDVSSDQMFFKERDNADPIFQLYDTGIYRLSTSHTTNNIFQNSPAKAKLLSNHHEIARAKPDKFFYSNQFNNFFVRGIERFRHPIEDILATNVGVLMGRQGFQLAESSDVSLVPGSGTPSRNITANFGITMSRNVSSLFDAINLNGLSAAVELSPPFVIFLGKRYVFQTFYHPYVCSFIKTLNTNGIAGLFKEEIQNRTDKEIFTASTYNPTASVATPYPKEKIEFEFTGVYSLYNWELFFHIPLLVATRLSQNQKFEEARSWFHYIFDPTKSTNQPGDGAERFWITKPFKNEILNPILSLEELFDDQHTADLQQQLDYWVQNPFKPHAVARLRLSAYMRTTVMKYIDNLIAWGDNLFRRDTIESINEATLLYILAGNILGKKPEKIPSRAIPVERSFSTIQSELDQFSNAMVEVQSFISPAADGDTSSEYSVLMPLFCIPKNDKLLGYWDTVNDRLFKIRHCMNIEGVVRQLALFEPPIDPALLVKATTMGLDLNSIMNDVNVSLPGYRFQFILQKAYEFCNDVRGLGNELLSALEKGDAEQLSLLRSSHEIKLLEAIRDVKIAQRDEAKENLRSTLVYQTLVEQRRDYYATRPYKNAAEEIYFTSTNIASKLQQVIALNNTLASAIYLIPTSKIGGPFTMGIEGGGLTFGNAATAGIEATEAGANLLRLYGEMAGVKGSYDRRQDDWKFQAQSAETELKQAEKQIAAAEIRLALAEKELENHDLQTENNKTVDDFVRSKFTNTELYDYMTGQISALYFQTYQMAYSIAKKAEKCMQHELGIEDTTHIKFGYWDSLKKGLMSGEKLQYDLRKLENSYLEQNQREFEITKHISLAMVDARAILELRQTGTCNFQLPEVLFEMDFPGHYFRRIKSIAVNIPCIAGPYTSVSSQLTLNKSYIRIKDENGDVAFDFANPSADFRLSNSAVKAIATSNGQGDTGMFEFNFRDDRYLPFEVTGVISDWSLELPTAARQFDYNTISDIIITIRYTSRDTTQPAFKAAVNNKIKDAIEETIALLNDNGGLFKLISLKNDFPDLYYQMHADNETSAVSKELKITKTFFPFFTGSYALIFKGCTFYNKDGTAVSFTISASNPTGETIDNTWKLILNYNPADIKNQEDVYVLINYSLE